MKRFIIIIIYMLCAFTVSVQAQEPISKEKRHQQIEAIKIGYLTRRLDLTAEESQKFWPIYNEYQKSISTLIHQKRSKRIANAENPEKSIDDDFSYDSQILEVRKKYRQDFGRILTPTKLQLLYTAEREFKEELIKQLKQRKSIN